MGTDELVVRSVDSSVGILPVGGALTPLSLTHHVWIHFQRNEIATELSRQFQPISFQLVWQSVFIALLFIRLGVNDIYTYRVWDKTIQSNIDDSFITEFGI